MTSLHNLHHPFFILVIYLKMWPAETHADVLLVHFTLRTLLPLTSTSTCFGSTILTCCFVLFIV
ncbi:hypothetical protein BJX70DRAFT_209599 [Aspergillus crustosus]